MKFGIYFLAASRSLSGQLTCLMEHAQNVSWKQQCLLRPAFRVVGKWMLLSSQQRLLQVARQTLSVTVTSVAAHSSEHQVQASIPRRKCSVWIQIIDLQQGASCRRKSCEALLSLWVFLVFSFCGQGSLGRSCLSQQVKYNQKHSTDSRK